MLYCILHDLVLHQPLHEVSLVLPSQVSLVRKDRADKRNQSCLRIWLLEHVREGGNDGSSEPVLEIPLKCRERLPQLVDDGQPGQRGLASEAQTTSIQKFLLLLDADF
jgi:hypothetical protein